MADMLNKVIRETTISFATRIRTQADLTDMIAARNAEGLPCLVAEQAGQILGYACAAPFRAGEGYAMTLEHSIYVRPDVQGRGVGWSLMKELETSARHGGAHSLVAGISAENAPALAFHARAGFAQVGRIADAGFKFGRRIDLVLLQKHLSSLPDTR